MLEKYIEEKRIIIEKNLKKALSRYKNPDRLSGAMEYGVMNGGKRIRPIICYIMCDLFEENYEKVEDIAVALEFIHCYSLIHDDLPAMDNDMYRRGKFTVHIKYDEATAILTGDVLLTEAFNIIVNSKKINDYEKVEIIKKLSEYSGFYGLIGGQYVDVESENKRISKETLEYIHSNKTGKLLLAAIELPLIIMNIDIEKKEKLMEFAKLIGIAFQIKDDILDIEGNFEKIGKKSNDVENNKNTYPSLYGINESKMMLKEYLEKSKTIIEKYFNGNTLLMELADFFGNRER